MLKFGVRAPWAPRQRGVSLIEVLVSILIVSVGVMAMAGMMVKSTQMAKISESRAIAAGLAADMADRIKVNAAQAAAGAYNDTGAFNAAVVKKVDSDCTALAMCTRPALAADDLATWKTLVRNSLADGTGYLRYNAAANSVDLWVAWSDAKAMSMGESDEFKTLDEVNCPDDYSSKKMTPPLPRCVYYRVSL
jgi:type IV pilus assembly protein PilV